MVDPSDYWQMFFVKDVKCLVDVLLTGIFVLFARKALSLTHYLLSESHSDCSVFAQLGFPHLMMRLASSDDSGVREAALGGLLELARDTTLGNRSLLADHERLQRFSVGV